MAKFRNYDIRVWDNGDVTLGNPLILWYAQVCGLSGLECNYDKSDPLYPVIRERCADVANAMRALDETVTEIERRTQ